MRGTGALSKQVGPLETPNNFGHNSTDLIQCRNDRFPISDPRLIERYIEGKLHIVLDFTYRDGEQFAALLQRRNRTLESNESTAQIGSHITPRVASEEELLQSRLLGWQNEMRGMPCYGAQEQPVLVDVVKSMESPERLIPSLVWFERMEKFLGIWPQAVYFSLEKAFGVIRGTDCNREGCVNRRTVASNCDKFVNQVVEGAAKVLQSVPGDGGELSGDVAKAVEIVGTFSRLSVVLMSDAVFLASEKSLTSTIKINDVLIGPFELY
jgi:hypothetical protein